MSRSWKLFGPPSTRRTVDHGRVWCPVQAADIDVEQCVDCPLIGEIVEDGEGHVVELVCRPGLRATWGYGLE